MNTIAPLFPYNPGVGQWFSGITQHAQAIDRFSVWLSQNDPATHTAVMKKSPILLNGGEVAASGALTPKSSRLAGVRFAGSRLAGLGADFTVDPITGDVTLVPDTSAAATVPSPVTAWGSQILDIAKGVIGLKQANDLTKLNIARAEAGLPPIDQGGVAPQVNLGLSASTQKLAIYGGIALIAVMALRGLKKR